MWCSAAATRKSWIRFRKEWSAGTTAMRPLAGCVCGKSIRTRAVRNGASCKTRRKIAMYLYFLRHGEADWPDWKKSDDERPLTEFGKKEMCDVAKFLDRLKVRPDLVVTSPLPRASQTAKIAAEHVKATLRMYEL